MKRIDANALMTGVLTTGLFLVGCTGDDTTQTSESDTETEGGDDGNMTMTMTTMGMDTTMGGMDTTMGDDDDDDDDDDSESSDDTEGPPDPVPVDMFLEITNVSGDAVITTPISPGVWLNHEQTNPELIFPEDMPDPGEGLEALAEDGDPTDLAAALMDNAGHLLSGVFDTGEMSGMAGPIAPGDSYRVEFTADPFSRISMAMMIVGSNDQIIATGAPGIGLFAGGGQPLGVRDVTNVLDVWDAGTEGNQAPSQGPWQALHGGSPNMGAPESGGVFPHTDSTRAIPLPVDLVSVDVEVTPGENEGDDDSFMITLTNISEDRGTLVTPLSNLFYMTHDDTVSLFEPGTAASAELEALAEDGDSSGLTLGFAGADGVGVAGAQTGPFAPGETITLMFDGNADTPWLSFATMVVESNDAFLAPASTGAALYDEDGDLLGNDEIAEGILHTLTVWDAGTEANETPGVGPNQVLRQADVNTGPADTDTNVRIYQDVGSDLEGDFLGGVIAVSITEDTMTAGDFLVHIENVSAATGYPAIFTPAFHMVHDDSVMMFETGSMASPGLESLAEDGDATGLVGEWDGMAGVSLADVYDQPENMDMDPLPAGPLMPGEFYEFTVTPDATNRFFSFATMVVPSNDTFAAFGAGGVALLDSMGNVRTNEAIAADIASDLAPWDAGTEANQAGAAGRDQAPRQAAANTGEGNGSGLIRVHEDGPGNVVIWSAATPEQMVQVRVGPVE